jgi:hypothetical protein
MRLWLLALLKSVAAGSLTLERYSNTALAGTASVVTLDTLSLVLPGALPFASCPQPASCPFSAEVSGSLFPRLASNASWWSFECSFDNIDYAFVRIDGHVVCQHGAYNNTGMAALDPGRFRLRSKQSELAVLASVYHTQPSEAPAVVELRWCEEGDSTRCVLLPSAALSPTLPSQPAWPASLAAASATATTPAAPPRDPVTPSSASGRTARTTRCTNLSWRRSALAPTLSFCWPPRSP